MRFLMMKLLVRFSRYPLRLHFRLSLSLSDQRLERIIPTRMPWVIARVRWILAIGRAPPS